MNNVDKMLGTTTPKTTEHRGGRGRVTWFKKLSCKPIALVAQTHNSKKLINAFGNLFLTHPQCHVNLIGLMKQRVRHTEHWGGGGEGHMVQKAKLQTQNTNRAKA